MAHRGLAVLIAGVSAVAGILVGFDTAVIAGALDFVAGDLGLGIMAQASVVTCILIGGLIGALGAGPLVARLGARPTMAMVALVFAVAALACAFAGGLWPLLAARTVLGLAVGAATLVAPLYVAETAPAAWRGALVSLFQLAITLGILLAYVANYVFEPSGDWRSMLGSSVPLALLLLVALIPLPESPRWLAAHGRPDAARAVFRRLGEAVPGDAELALMAADDPERAGGWGALLSRRVRPVLVVAAGLFLFTNLSGIDAILYYAPQIFKGVGVSSSAGQILGTMGLGAVNVAATVVAMWLVDRAGRRPLLLWGTAPMTASLAVFALLIADSDISNEAGGLIALACLGIYVTAFAVSLGPLPYVLMAEVFPLDVRGLGMAVAAATAWTVNALVSIAFLPLAETLGQSTVFTLFALICAAAFLFCWRLVPETRGRSLEHIEANLRAGRPTRELGAP